jgi:peptidoglycan-N-acetylglucosamine deacetylase
LASRSFVPSRLAPLLLVLIASGTYAAAPSPSSSPSPAAARARVALTFDDLPVHAALPSGKTRLDIAKSIVESLKAHQAPPTYGFVNAKALEEDPQNLEVLRLWRAAGHPLGNHTYSHIDLHANPVEAFEQDLIANEKTLIATMDGEDWHWLRYPYLREGDTLEKRRAVREFLGQRGYRVAEVTLSFDDYAYNDPYARCLARDDQPAIDWLKESYLTRAGESLAAGQDEARRIWGRDIAHVMLLHIGGFQIVMLPRLLDLLADRGFQLVTLQEAQGDPAYATDPDTPSPGGATLLDQMMRIRGLPRSERSQAPFARLDGLCH